MFSAARPFRAAVARAGPHGVRPSTSLSCAYLTIL
jgi:hypothetical protein